MTLTSFEEGICSISSLFTAVARLEGASGGGGGGGALLRHRETRDAKYLLSDQQKKEHIGFWGFFSSFPSFIATNTCCLVSSVCCHSWDVL